MKTRHQGGRRTMYLPFCSCVQLVLVSTVRKRSKCRVCRQYSYHFNHSTNTKLIKVPIQLGWTTHETGNRMLGWRYCTLTKQGSPSSPGIGKFKSCPRWLLVSPVVGIKHCFLVCNSPVLPPCCASSSMDTDAAVSPSKSVYLRLR